MSKEVEFGVSHIAELFGRNFIVPWRKQLQDSTQGKESLQRQGLLLHIRLEATTEQAKVEFAMAFMEANGDVDVDNNDGVID